MKEINEKIGKKPSPGSMYPLLDDLLNKKLVKSKKDGKKIIYTLTKEGKNKIEEFSLHHEEMFEKFKKNIEIISTLSSQSESSCLKSLTEAINNKFIPFQEFSHELIDLKMTLWKLISTKKTDKKSKEIKKILKETTNKLKKIK